MPSVQQACRWKGLAQLDGASHAPAVCSIMQLWIDSLLEPTKTDGGVAVATLSKLHCRSSSAFSNPTQPTRPSGLGRGLNAEVRQSMSVEAAAASRQSRHTCSGMLHLFDAGVC